MEKLLEQIKDFADKAHGDQTRKYSTDRYIVHPVRVMQTCKKFTSAIPILAAALLHDVLEDTSVGNNQMHSFLSSVMNEGEANETMKLVIELTDVYTKIEYPGWNRRKRKARESARIEQTSADSQTIKYADIIDNCKEIAIQDPEFAGLFLYECKMLLKKMQKGNQELYKEAVETVEECISQVPREFRMFRHY